MNQQQPTPPAEPIISREADGPAVPEGREPASVVGEPSDEELLEQRHPAPVPVAERSPGPEDCDEEGCIWLWDTDCRWVRQRRDAAASNSWIGSSWLPGHALPLPAGEVE